MKSPKEIIVNDKMQVNYKYILTCEEGKQFSSDFKPDLSPKEMLELGVFGGKYMTDCRDEFPNSWFIKAKINSEKYDTSLNYFGVRASQLLTEWRKKGWIHGDDPRG